LNIKIKYIEEDSVNHHTHKVIYPRLSTDEPYYTYIIANGDSSSAMLVGSKEEGENLVKLMKSKLYKWIGPLVETIDSNIDNLNRFILLSYFD